MKVLLFFPSMQWHKNMDRTRRSYVEAIAACSELETKLVIYDENTDALEEYNSFLPDAIFTYKPISIKNYDQLPDNVLKILNYNESHKDTIAAKEINKSKSNIIITHHDIPGRNEITSHDIKHPYKLYYIPHCITNDFCMPSSRIDNRPIDILVTGALAPPVYPLRCRLADMIRKGMFSKYNCKIRNHPNYWIDNSENQQKDYINALQNSKLTVACSSIFKYRLSKYSEYPACGSVLLGDLPLESDDVLKEIESYSIIIDNSWSDKQIVERVEFYLGNKDLLEEKKQNGLRIIDEKYRVKNYVDRFVTILKENLGNKTSIPKKDKVLLVYDVDGWAWHNKSLALQKYLPNDKFEVDICSGKEFRNVDTSKYNIIKHWDVEASNPKRNSTTGVYSYGYLHNLPPYQRMVDLVSINCVNKEIYDFAKKSKWNKNIFLCHNGVDTSLFNPKFELRNPCKLTIGFSSKKTAVHFDLKGYRTIWLPLVEKLKQHPEIEIIENSNQFDSADVVPHNQMGNFYNKLDILINCSWSDASTNSVTEAMACGCVVIATNQGIIPELTSKGVIKIPKYDMTATSIAITIERFYENIIKILNTLNYKELLFNMGLENSQEINDKWEWSILMEDWTKYLLASKMTYKPPVSGNNIIPITTIPYKRIKKHVKWSSK